MSDAATLGAGLEALSVDLPASARQQLLDYARLLLKWNRTYNLTAIRDAAQVVSHHLLDSLSVLPHLDGAGSLADIGSGGGLPGIALAIARPDLQVLSIEAVSKKASFQQQARIELALPNFRPIHSRVEDFVPETPVDAVISRAFSDLGDFVRLSAHLLAPEGSMLAMKGVYPNEEVAALPPGFRVAAGIELAVPGVDAARHLIIVKPDGSA